MLTMAKAIRVQLFQQMSNYRKPSSFTVRESFPLPPYSSVIGMIHTACGFEAYHPMQISIQGSSAGEVSDCMTMYSFGIKYDPGRHQYKVKNENGEYDGITRGMKYAHLLTDVYLVIHILPDRDEDYEQIVHGLQYPQNFISLGRHEDIVRIDEVTEVELGRMDPEDDYVVYNTKFSSYLPTAYYDEDDNTREGIEGTIYMIPKIFEITKKGRQWKKVVSARLLPEGMEIINRVMEHENVFYDAAYKLPVFFA